MSRIQLDQLRKAYGAVDAVNGVSLDIPDGSFVTLLGPSGCGKTTTLNCIAGLEDVSQGSIYFDTENVTDWSPRDRNIAMVFQDYALYPHMDVFDNIAFGLRQRRAPSGEIRSRVTRAAEVLGLGPLLHRRPAELSGGQRQRVALGRAIVREATAFLMDEPLSNLDATLRVQTRSEIKRLQQQLGVTTVYVTHDQEEAMVLSDMIAVMRDGRVLQYSDSTTAYFQPSCKFVASFIGSPPINFVSGTLSSAGEGYLFRCNDFEVRLPAGAVRPGSGKDLRSAQPVTLGARPEDVSIAPPGATGGLAARVLLVEPVGATTYVTVQRGDTSLKMSVSGNARFRVDDTIRITLDEEKAMLFDDDSEARL
jgi:multiple sugar transport system ATP-binding protein